MTLFSFAALRRLVAASTVAMLLVPATPSAGPIGPGFDLFMTLPGTFADLGPLGIVGLKGLPIGPGTTDTIVQRLGGTSAGFDFGGPPETIPIEIVALSLVSVAPVFIVSSFFDVFVTLDPVPLGPTVGTMVVSHQNASGGTFNAQLPVNALLTFSEVGNPLNTFASSFFDVFVSLDVPWSHDPPPHDKHGGQFPAGGFFPSGPFSEAAQLAMHVVGPAVPAPGTAALLGLGITVLWFGGRTRRGRSVSGAAAAG